LRLQRLLDWAPYAEAVGETDNSAGAAQEAGGGQWNHHSWIWFPLEELTRPNRRSIQIQQGIGITSRVTRAGIERDRL